MMYGENGNQIRAELTTLLRQHRIQRRLGGDGGLLGPALTTIEQRREMGEMIQRYRWSALMWCLQATTAVTSETTTHGSSRANRIPAEELRYRLAKTLSRMDFGLPPLDELTTRRDFPLVESWRQVARAAVLGEHDFSNGVEFATLTHEQRVAVIQDAAEITRAILVLDKRYEDVPGWKPIRGRGMLSRAASVCTNPADHTEPDYAVDHRGWRPTAALVEGGPLPGIGGVIQAEHNMLVHLATFPDALNLRRVLRSQAIVSHEAARRAPNVAPELIEKWLEREQTYKRLVDETRDVGGLIGKGGQAAAEAANVVGRLRHVHVDDLNGPEPLRDLDRLFSRTDARVASIIEQGAAERLYFVNVKVPRIVDKDGEVIRPAHQQYVPIEGPLGSDLLGVVRDQLRPPPVVPAAPAGAHESREEMRESIDHKPDRRSPLDR